jgi:hypothetical protein
MAYEQKDNSGTLFKNDRREKDSHPHATGTALIDGVEYWISAWTKDGQKGRFQSLSFKRKEPKRAQREQRTSYDDRPRFERDDNGEIPF